MIKNKVILMLFAYLFLGSCREISDESSALKIFNGTAADLSSDVSKHTVALVRKAEPHDPFCTGILISERYVLTAAHCFFTFDWRNPEKVSVAFGLGLVPEHRVSVVEADEFFHDDTIVKDGWDVTPTADGYRISDIAVLRLPAGTTIPDFMTPVAIAGSNEFPSGTPAIIAGYGSLGMKEDDSVHGSPIPNSPLRLYEAPTRIAKIAETQGVIMYSSDNRLNSACFGDSGGPMFIQDPISKELKLVGVGKSLLRDDVNSRKCIGKGLYTNAAFFKTWINKQIALQ